MQTTEQAVVQALNPNMWPLYENIPWRKKVGPMCMAVVVGTTTDNVYRTPYVEVPTHHLIFPEKESHEDYRVIASYHYSDDEHFEQFRVLPNSQNAFLDFFRSNVMHYAMVVAGTFNSLQSQAITMPSWKVKEATDNIGNLTAELGYFVAASLSQNGVNDNQVIVEAISFVGALGNQINVPVWSQVSSQYVYKGALQFINDKTSGSAPDITVETLGENSSTPEIDMDVYGSLSALFDDDKGNDDGAPDFA